MKKDDIILIRIVSVAVLLAALALIIVFGARISLFDSICDEIYLGNITDSLGGFPLYSKVYYQGMGVIYKLLFSIILYSCIISVAGIFLRLRGVASLANIGSITSVVTGFFLIISKVFENNALIHRLFSFIYLGEAGSFDKNVDEMHFIPGRVVYLGVILIILGIFCCIMIKTSSLKKLKNYRGAYRGNWAMFIMPVVYGCVFLEIIRGVLFNISFSSNSVSMQTYGIIIDYYLADRFLITTDRIIIVVLSGLITLVLLRAGIKKKLIRHILCFITAFACIIRGMIFLFNPPRLFGYISMDEMVCDRIESVGGAAMILFLLDVVILSVITSVAFDISRGVINKKMLIITSVSMIISSLAIFLGVFIPIMAVYIILIVINLVLLLALNEFAYVS